MDVADSNEASSNNNNHSEPAPSEDADLPLQQQSSEAGPLPNDEASENNVTEEPPVQHEEPSLEAEKSVETPEASNDNEQVGDGEDTLTDEPPPVPELDEKNGDDDQLTAESNEVQQEAEAPEVEEMTPPVPEVEVTAETPEPKQEITEELAAENPVEDSIPNTPEEVPEVGEVPEATAEPSGPKEEVTEELAAEKPVETVEDSVPNPPEEVPEVSNQEDVPILESLEEPAEVKLETNFEESPIPQVATEIPELSEAAEGVIGEPLEKPNHENEPVASEAVEPTELKEAAEEPSPLSETYIAKRPVSMFTSLPVTSMSEEKTENGLLHSLPIPIPTITIEEVLTDDDKLRMEQEMKAKEENERLKKEKKDKAKCESPKAESPLRRFVIKNFGVYEDPPAAKSEQEKSEESNASDEAQNSPTAWNDFVHGKPTEPQGQTQIEATAADKKEEVAESEPTTVQPATEPLMTPPIEEAAVAKEEEIVEIKPPEVETTVPPVEEVVIPKKEDEPTIEPTVELPISKNDESPVEATRITIPEQPETPPPSPDPLGAMIRESGYEEEQPTDQDDSDRWMKTTVRGSPFMVDLRAIQPYKKFLSFGGFTERKEAIIVFTAAYLPMPSEPNYNYIINHLFCYITSAIDLLAPDEYVVVYFHCFRSSGDMPPLAFCNSCYGQLDFRLRKSAKAVYVVHGNAWVKTASAYLSAFKQFARRKLIYVQNLANLKALIPTDYIFFPKEVTDAEKSVMKHSS